MLCFVSWCMSGTCNVTSHDLCHTCYVTSHDACLARDECFCDRLALSAAAFKVKLAVHVSWYLYLTQTEEMFAGAEHCLWVLSCPSPTIVWRCNLKDNLIRASMFLQHSASCFILLWNIFRFVEWEDWCSFYGLKHTRYGVHSDEENINRHETVRFVSLERYVDNNKVVSFGDDV
jgi:hypothetical protein